MYPYKMIMLYFLRLSFDRFGGYFWLSNLIDNSFLTYLFQKSFWKSDVSYNSRNISFWF